ncbi:MAG TPA: assimilatory sulfite reductase (NADPH) flavoprotein subunit [Sphingomonadaceae bacterium]|nr:assimilatory sulfite reductase (NADPH) flavoprotein subunit [Sphingomonadaceae bacterium]
MTASQFPGAALTAEQWRLVEALGASLNPQQARWISGYFAGLDSGLLRGGVQAGAAPLALPSAAAAPGTRALTILYGSETGNSAELAANLAAAAREQGLDPVLADMGEYKTRKLKDEQDLLILISTHGEGDPPQPAAGFFDFVESRKAPKLPNLRYAVLALGDMTYEHFCGAGKRLDERFEVLGGSRLRARVDCDVDYEEPAEAWGIEMLAMLAADRVDAVPAVATTGAMVVPAPQPAAAASAYGKRNPFPATVIENMVLAGRGSTKETRHIEISIEDSGLQYEPGDALGIVSRNDPALVDSLLGALHMEGDAPLTVKGHATTLAEALADRFEITTATQRFLDHWGELTSATESFSAMSSAERAEFLHGNHIIDIVRAFPLQGIDPQRFVDGLRPLQPRLYSIASSLAVVPDEVHLTVSPVRYALHGEPRSGVASGHLADRAPVDSQLQVYIQSNPHFRLPDDDRPIIMIGAGTGVAPYRSFLQEREARGSNGRSWLFFGERNFRTDFLYQIEWQTWLKDDILTRMDVAFSRDHAEKVYVQHRISEQARDVYAWLEEGAHVYVCGDATHLAPDVHEALLNVVEEQASIQREAAEEYFRDLQRDGRYQRDVY